MTFILNFYWSVVALQCCIITQFINRHLIRIYVLQFLCKWHTPTYTHTHTHTQTHTHVCTHETPLWFLLSVFQRKVRVLKCCSFHNVIIRSMTIQAKGRYGLIMERVLLETWKASPRLPWEWNWSHGLSSLIVKKYLNLISNLKKIILSPSLKLKNKNHLLLH